MVNIFICYRGPFSIQIVRYSEGVGGVGGEKDEAAGRVGEGFAHEECRGFPLVSIKKKVSSSVI